MNEAEAIQILYELGSMVLPGADLLSGAFDKQLAAINDPAKLKCVFCTRRAAKSYTSGLYLFKEALETPKCNVLYIGLTRDSAKRIMWKDVLMEINEKHKLGASSNLSELTFTMPNGSKIYLIGADADDSQKSKILGQKFKLAIVDEAASYTIDLRELVYGVLKPAVADYRGTICLTGTAGNLVKGLFYDVTNGIEPGWSRHSWSTFDNPYMATQWQEEIADLKLANPHIIETALFRQMYLNEWVIDADKLVYKFKADRNYYTELPVKVKLYHFILGIDLGYNDDTAFTVSAWHPEDPNLYFRTVYKKPHMDLTDVANKVRELERVYKFDVEVVDGSNKQAVMELNNRHGLNLIPADKSEKTDFIEIFNADLIQGKIKVHVTDCKPLVDEWQTLIWDDKSLKRREHPNCPNHLADSALYNWRYTYSYLSKQPVDKSQFQTPQWFKDEENRIVDRVEKKYEMEKAIKEDDIWKDDGDDYWGITDTDFA